MVSVFQLTLNLILGRRIGLNRNDLASEAILRLCFFGSLFKNITTATGDVYSSSVVSECSSSGEAETSSSTGD